MGYGRAHQRRQRQWILGVLLATGALGVIAVGVFLRFSVKPPQLDEEYCPSSIAASYAILIDATDALSAVQRKAVENEIARVIKAIPRYGRVQLYVVQDTRGSLPVPFSLCNPGRVEDANWLIESEKLVQRFHDAFSQKIDERLLTANTATSQPSSPIIEVLQALAVTAFGDLAPFAQKRLIIVSDLIQNSDRLSFYRTWPLTAKEAKRSDLQAQLEGVVVSVLLIDRPSSKHIQDGQLIPFWSVYLQTSGAVWSDEASVRIVAG